MLRGLEMSTVGPDKVVYYTSEYRNSVDEKRRIQIPAKWRAGSGDLGFTLIVWPGGGGGACIRGLPPQQMDELMRTIARMPVTDPKAVALRRLIGSKTEISGLDKSGRLCIPEPMARAAAIEREAVVVGLLDRFELWNPERYSKTSAADEALMDAAFQLLDQPFAQSLEGGIG